MPINAVQCLAHVGPATWWRSYGCRRPASVVPVPRLAVPLSRRACGATPPRPLWY